MVEPMDRRDWAGWEQRLRDAHRRRPEPNLGREWQAGLMREIMLRADRSRLEAQARGAAFLRLSWRFAGAAAVLAVALGLYAQLCGPDLEVPTAGLVLERPLGVASLEHWLQS